MYKMVVLSEIKPHSNAVHYFKDLPCYNKPIGKTKKKTFKNIDQLVEVAFYEQVSAIIKFKPLEEMQCHIKLK